MTIHIPDDLARGLQGIAAAQQKTVEQVALDSLRALFDRASSPEVALRTMVISQVLKACRSLLWRSPQVRLQKADARDGDFSLMWIAGMLQLT
jgi:hypothetical protein